MNRRRFVTLAGAGAIGLGSPVSRVWAAAGRVAPPVSGALRPLARRHPLRVPDVVSAADLRLVASPATVDIGRGATEAWTLNGALPSPIIRARRGERASILLENDLPESTILHWHGLDVPEAADGHPRLAIAPGDTYQYDFVVEDRAGLYWYHPHTHGRTGAQTYKGMAGLIVVEDEEESALGLPSGELDLPIVLQDKRLGDGTSLAYERSMGPDVMYGYLGDTAVANGVIDPTVEVHRTGYRLRLLNASNARVLELGLSNGRPFTLIGTDGGLLQRPVTLDRIMMGTGERADILVDFSSLERGERVYLRSFEFQIPGMMGMMGGRGMAGGGMGRGRGMGRGGMMMGGLPQGAAMDLVEFVASDAPAEAPRTAPAVLSSVPRIQVVEGATRRTFRFESAMMQHTINGRSFDLERVDVRVPRGQPERWTIENSSGLPHPVHIHVGQFQILARTGGRNRIMPWETGLKDTVLVWPEERVEVGVHFRTHRGLFLLHCHNLEHEDMGMMLNFEVV